MAIVSGPERPGGGDADLAAAASLFADPGRARILLALLDGRALPASVLATEAGVSASATSAHLAKLVDGGLLHVECSGRHRYHRLAGDHVAAVLESLAALSPTRPVHSLREHTRAAALRHARSCYDHLAGAWGVAITSGLVERGVLRVVDDVAGTCRREGDPYAAPLPEHPYELGPRAGAVLDELGVDLDELTASPSRRPLLRFCVDWSEQRHHLAGRLGACLLAGLRAQDWVRDGPRRRTLVITEQGRRELRRTLGVAAPCGTAS